MPPISTGSERPFGVTMRFAPRLRSSRFTRSPISSITPSMAVATAVPMATAAMVMALRRGERRIDWLTKRRNISRAGRAENPGAPGNLIGSDHELIAFHAGRDGDGIASAHRAQGRDVDGRRAVLANHIRPVLIVALVAADGAGVEGSSQRLVGTADDDHAHRHAARCDGEAVQIAVADRGHGDA